jgi:hypothetical protein
MENRQSHVGSNEGTDHTARKKYIPKQCVFVVRARERMRASACLCDGECTHQVLDPTVGIAAPAHFPTWVKGGVVAAVERPHHGRLASALRPKYANDDKTASSRVCESCL